MPRTRRRKCLHCQELFRADARNRGRQKYCLKLDCRRAAKAARQGRWLAQPENQNYFRDAQNAARVRAWQRAHPGSWRNAQALALYLFVVTRRTDLARRDRQRAPAWGDPSQARGAVPGGTSAFEVPERPSLRLGPRALFARQQPVPFHVRSQPLLSASGVCRAPSDRQSLPGPAVHLPPG